MANELRVHVPPDPAGATGPSAAAATVPTGSVAADARPGPGRCPMKPAPFTYHRPETLADALGLLAALGE